MNMSHGLSQLHNTTIAVTANKYFQEFGVYPNFPLLNFNINISADAVYERDEMLKFGRYPNFSFPHFFPADISTGSSEEKRDEFSLGDWPGEWRDSLFFTEHTSHHNCIQ
jgi:hypothetical protein